MFIDNAKLKDKSRSPSEGEREKGRGVRSFTLNPQSVRIPLAKKLPFPFATHMAEKKQPSALEQLIALAGAAVIIVVAIAIAAAAVVFAPGIALVAACGSFFRLTLDRGQMWTFSVLASIASFAVMYLAVATLGTERGGRLRSSTTIYIVIATIIVILGAISHFGFHAMFFARALNSLYGWPDVH